MIHYLFVAIGSALGGVLRFWTANQFERRLGPEFPWGTVFVNVLGSFIIGLIAALAVKEHSTFHPLTARNFGMVGFLGGFTTFSAFSLQTLQLFQAGKPAHALANVLGSICLCLIGVWLGYLTGQTLSR